VREVNRGARLTGGLVVCRQLSADKLKIATTPVLHLVSRTPLIGHGMEWRGTYRAIATLLAEMALPVAGQPLLSSLQLPDTRVHALGHVLLCCVLGSGNKEQLELQLSNLIRGTPDNRCVS